MDLFTYLMAKKGHNTHRDLFSYLLGSGNKLPSEYQRLEYIESTGTQYINTGRIPSNNEDVKIKCFINPLGSHPVYGAYNKTTQSRRHIWSDSSKMDLGWGVTALCSLDVNYSNILNISAHFQAGNQKLTVNGSSNSSNSNANTNPNLTAYLFARHNSNGTERGILMRLYSCKIYDNGVLVRNFIPCMRKSDNEVGLYDTVGEQFYTNAGTGTFVTPTSQLSSTQSLNTSLLSNNIQEETNLDDINEIEDIDEPIENEEIEEPIEEYQEL